MDVELRVELRGAGGPTLHVNGWLYLLQGSTVTVTHTDELGRAHALRAGGNATHPWEYTARFVVTVGAQLSFYHSAGKAPIPSRELSSLAAAFEPLTVPPPGAQVTQVGGTGTNTVALTPVSKLSLTPHILQFSSPLELELLPVTFTAFSPTYLTDGLANPPFNAAGLTVTEDAVATPPAAASRPRERAPQVSGLVDAAATAVRIRCVNAQGNAVQLRASGAATSGVPEVPATLGPVSGANRSFQVDLLFDDPPGTFGAIQVLAFVDGLAKPVVEAAFYVLTGVQVALVDDRDTNNDGSQPGPIRGEAEDNIVVDFLNSPIDTPGVITAAEQVALTAAQVGQPPANQRALQRAAQKVANDRQKPLNRVALTAESRARRMVRAIVQSRQRPLSATQPVQVFQPEMPLWMGELQLLGLSQATTEDLLQRRRHARPAPAPGAPPTPAVPLLRISFNWALAMQWDAPNSAATTRPFRYQETFNAAVSVALDLDASDRLDGITNRVATKAFTPAPTALAFPVATRRAPQARFDDRRPWGRVANATQASTLLVEFQPAIVNGTQEVMRTGDADLSVTGLLLDGAAVRLGRDPQGSSFVVPPAAEQPLKVPTIRVCGTTPAAADIDTLIDALVTEFFNANSTRAHVAQLPVARWQETVRRIVRHESGNPPLRHFETRGAGRRAFGVAVFGHEQHMPLFGAPAGFGLGQLDNPPVTRNQMFSYLEGLRASIALIMDAKARAVHGLVSPHVAAFPAATIAAVFQRAVVRAYNGNSEFRFNAGAFEIFPTGTDAARLNYPNIVLGTGVVYRGFRTAVPFTSADFGP
jgi:hypothetical protein